MTGEPDESALILANRPVGRGEAWTRVLRYCGLPWDDHPPETWAFRYFDLIETDPAVVIPQDVLCAGALHHGLTREDLTWFWDHRCDLENWLSGIPVDQALRTADDATVAALSELPSRFAGPPLSLVTKVLHRKRPWLIPIVDRELIDRYRPLTGERRPDQAWAPLFQELAHDLRKNQRVLAEFRFTLRMLHGFTVTDLRTLDIVVWMEGQR